MKKRPMILIASLFAVCTLFTACGGTPDEPVPGTSQTSVSATVSDPLPAATSVTEVTETTVSEPDYFRDTHIEPVTPDASKVCDMTITGDGYDIFAPLESQTLGAYGYRYGVTYLYNPDGSADAWFASTAGSAGEWDWITYRHSPDGGQTWGKEKVVLTPTPDSLDRLSTCDPGVIFINGYYYLGYTSTVNTQGCCNNLFVARSEHPDGPYEKWNGSGWGGQTCEPVIYYDEEYGYWGIGQPSFVELNGTLYVYYSYESQSGCYVMLATADAADENWPAHLQYHGAVLKGSIGSIDIKYVEDWGKFVGFCTAQGFSASSALAVYESNDGCSFSWVDAVREGTYAGLHNVGLSSRRNGRIRLSEDADKLRAIYAYGDVWALWNTRVQPISLTLTAGNDIEAERQKDALPDPMNRWPDYTEETNYWTMVRPAWDAYVQPVTKNSFTVSVNLFDAGLRQVGVREGITFSDYDESVCVFDGIRCRPQGVGTTSVTVHYEDLQYRFWVTITEEEAAGEKVHPVSFAPVRSEYTIFLGEKDVFKPQIRGRIINSDGSVDEVYVDNASRKLPVQGETVTYTGYDASVISVSDKGIITALSTGETTVTVTWREFCFDVPVRVTGSEADAAF